MAKNPNFAQVAQITLGGGHKIQGLWHPGFDDFGVAAPQLAKLFQFDSSQASRTIKRLLGKDFQFDSWQSELNPDKVNVVLVKDFEKIIWDWMFYEPKRKDDVLIPGIKIAKEIGKDIFGMGLVERFRDGFGFESGKEFRDNFLEERVKQLESRNADLENNDECWRYVNKELRDEIEDLAKGMGEPDELEAENERLRRILRERGIDPNAPNNFI
ncbi:hypothetical protein [Moorena sp. SIO3A5]|uniref:hypothetical protein n=1 Tax=Moorena sp. SIO3A5 TaxID=2607822 RepID=UPI00141C7970|nr:hypothetical protein [Moorena sp. SIO3A5]NEP69000.1 hypothetical protein [Moorena sp. SIO3A5]NES80751.1 hypothetical protein [Moorena sp. SIO2B7]